MKTQLKAQIYIFTIDLIGLILTGGFLILFGSINWYGTSIVGATIGIAALFAFTGLSVENFDDIVEWLDSRNKPKDNPKPGRWKEKE